MQIYKNIRKILTTNMPFREYTDTQQDTKGPCSCSAFKRGVYEQGLFIIYLFSIRYKDIMFVLRE